MDVQEKFQDVMCSCVRKKRMRKRKKKNKNRVSVKFDKKEFGQDINKEDEEKQEKK